MKHLTLQYKRILEKYIEENVMKKKVKLLHHKQYLSLSSDRGSRKRTWLQEGKKIILYFKHKILIIEVTQYKVVIQLKSG